LGNDYHFTCEKAFDRPILFLVMDEHISPKAIAKQKVMRKLFFYFIGGFFLLSNVSALFALDLPSRPEYMWERKLPLTIPGDPLVLDMDGDGQLEVLFTDNTGRVCLLDAKSGRIIWRKTLDKRHSLTVPVAGNFTGDGSVDIVAGTSGKRLYLVNGADGKILAREDMSDSIILPPTLIPLKNDAKDGRAGVIVTDDRGNVSLYQFIRNNSADGNKTVYPFKAKAMWTIALNARVTAPASVGAVTALDAINIIVGTSNGDIWAFDRDNPANRIRFTNYDNRGIETIPALGQITGDERREVVYADKAGNLNVLFFQNGEFRRLWSKDRIIYEPPLQTLILQDLTNDGKDEIIVATEHYIFGFDGNTGKSIWEKDRISLTYSNSSEPGLIYNPGGAPILIIGDVRGKSLFINLSKGDAGNFWEMGKTFVKTPVVFNVEDIPRSCIMVISEAGSHCRTFKWSAPLPTGKALWETRGGNQFRTCKIDEAYNQFIENHKAYLLNCVRKRKETAEAAFREGKWDEALTGARGWLALQPRNVDAQKMLARAKFRRYFFIYIGAFLISAGLFYIIISRLLKLFITLRLIAKARDYVERESLGSAIQCYRRALQKNPANRGIMQALGQALMRVGEFDKENIPIFETTYEMDKQNPEALKALALAYLHSDIMEDKALIIYQRALDHVDNKAAFEHIIGKIYLKKGEYETAGKYVRRALRSREANLDMYNTLTDIYLCMNFRTRKALPVFKKVYSHRRDDQRFLEALCDAYLDAKETDAEVREVCEAVLKGNHNYLGAYIQMAKIHIQDNNSVGAAKCAARILELDPTNLDGLLIQSQYYLLENRKDAQALEVYQRSLSHFPHNKEILRIVAHIYYEKRRFDSEAEDIYRRAIQLNPSDVQILLALAKIAQKSLDYDLSITSIEKLIDLGQFNNDLILQLADSYKIRHYTEARAEKIYQTAIKVHPDDTEFATLLAEVFMRQKKTDGASIHAYENALKINHTRDDIARQLIKSYIENRNFEGASRLAQFFLARLPGDEEFSRLMALADLQSNKIDEAIEEYSSLLKKNPNDPEALVNLAQAFAHKRLMNDTAADLYLKALQIAPENDFLHRIMACVLLSNGRISDGIEEFKKAVAANPKSVGAVIDDGLAMLAVNPDWMEARWFICRLMIESGRLREAMNELQTLFENAPEDLEHIIAAYQEILTKDPENAIALIQYGSHLKTLGRTEEARQAMEQAYRIMPNNPDVQREISELYEFILEEKDDIEVRFELGKLYLAMNQFDSAISCFQRTSQDFRWESESIKYLGRCFVRKGMLDLAMQEFKKLTIDDEMKDMLYDLAQRYEAKNDLVGAKQVYRQLFAADINYRNVRTKFEMLAGSTSDPMVFEKTTILNSLSDKAKRRYELLEEIGRGAMGIVYRAKDIELDEVVALKILPDNLSNNPEALQRFKAEARNARRLSHKNIVRIHDIGEEMGRKYISMEFVNGSDLKHIIRESGAKLPIEKTIKYMIQTAQALSYAHSIGIIHRDIKPANIMITKDDEVKVTDFGIAKMMEGSDATMTGVVIGTPLYMSPEQVRGTPADKRADIYSLGITMYDLLCGRPPFYEGDLAYQHLHVEPKPIEGVSPALMGIIQKCLMKNKEERWEDVGLVAEALSGIFQ